MGKRDNCWNCSKIFSLYLSFLLTCSQVCQKPKSNLTSLEIMVQGFKIPNLVEEYRTNFLGKRDKRLYSFENFSLYFSFPWIYFKVCQNRKWSCMSLGIEVRDFKIPNLVDEYKIIFLGKWHKRWNSSKTFSVYFHFL